jgi:hypothetical protein
MDPEVTALASTAVAGPLSGWTAQDWAIVIAAISSLMATAIIPVLQLFLSRSVTRKIEAQGVTLTQKVNESTQASERNTVKLNSVANQVSEVKHTTEVAAAKAEVAAVKAQTAATKAEEVHSAVVTPNGQVENP